MILSSQYEAIFQVIPDIFFWSKVSVTCSFEGWLAVNRQSHNLGLSIHAIRPFFRPMAYCPPMPPSAWKENSRCYVARIIVYTLL